jgi:hypothetical protein
MHGRRMRELLACCPSSTQHRHACSGHCLLVHRMGAAGHWPTVADAITVACDWLHHTDHGHWPDQLSALSSSETL